MKQICFVPCNSFSKTQVFSTVSTVHIYIYNNTYFHPENSGRLPFFATVILCRKLENHNLAFYASSLFFSECEENITRLFFQNFLFHWSYSPLPLRIVGLPPWLRYPVPFEGRMWTEEWIGTWLDKAMKDGKVQREKCLDDVGFVGCRNGGNPGDVGDEM